MGRQAIAMLPEARDAAVTLGALVRRYRQDRSMKIAELAARAGVSERTVSLIERGSPTVSIGNVFNVAAVVGVPLFGTADPTALALIAERERVIASQRLQVRDAQRGALTDADLDF